MSLEAYMPERATPVDRAQPDSADWRRPRSVQDQSTVPVESSEWEQDLPVSGLDFIRTENPVDDIVCQPGNPSRQYQYQHPAHGILHLFVHIPDFFLSTRYSRGPRASRNNGNATTAASMVRSASVNRLMMRISPAGTIFRIEATGSVIP